jgi:hypothetical protein
MNIYKVRYIPLVLLPVLLLISACSPSLGTGNSSLTVLQVLQNSAKAMKDLKSAHIETKTTGTLQTLGTPGTPTTSTSTPAPTTASSLMFKVSGSGDEALPNEEQLQVTVSQGKNGSPANLAEIVQGDKVYVQNTKGQWYVLDKSALEGFTGNPFSGINGLDPNALLGLLQDTQITDHGDGLLNGENLRHISVALDKAGFKKILDSDPQLGKMFGQQNIDTLLNNTKSFTSSLNLWIDETNFYVHRTELKVNVGEDISALSQSLTPVVTFPLPAGVITSFDSTLDLSKFNDPVTITPPTGAIPTDNPISIFS